MTVLVVKYFVFETRSIGQTRSSLEHYLVVYKSGFVLKKVCYKVSLCENIQQQSCKAFTALSNCAQMVDGRFCS